MLMRCCCAIVLLVQLAGCASWQATERDADLSDEPAESVQPRAEAVPAQGWGLASAAPGDQGPWRHLPLPGKRATEFRPAQRDGRETMGATAVSSASMLRKAVRVEPEALGRVAFSWLVPALIAQADMALRDADDCPVRIVLAFEGDRSRWSPRDLLLSELARALTGEEMPYATLMYVWSNHHAPGSVIRNPRTDRIRKLVVEMGSAGLGRWLDYERDVRADFRVAFGEDPGALVGIGIMSDSDNTRSHAQAWYGPVRMQPSAGVR